MLETLGIALSCALPFLILVRWMIQDDNAI